MLYLYVALLVLGWLSRAEAVRTVYSEGVITLKLELGQPTALVLPEEVSTVTTAMADKTTAMADKTTEPKIATLLISKDNMYVGFVVVNAAMPPNRNIVVGISGRVYLVNVELVQPGMRGDDLVYVTHKAPTQAPLLDAVSVLRRLRNPKGPGPAVPLTLALPTPADPRVMPRPAAAVIRWDRIRPWSSPWKTPRRCCCSWMSGWAIPVQRCR